MTRSQPRWSVRLTSAAISDLEEIGRWTEDRFGEPQRDAYAELIAAALKTLRSGPNVPGTRPLLHHVEGLMRQHIARHGRKGRHILIFRVINTERREIEVVRILHDSMDLARHLPKE